MNKFNLGSDKVLAATFTEPVLTGIRLSEIDCPCYTPVAPLLTYIRIYREQCLYSSDELFQGSREG